MKFWGSEKPAGFSEPLFHGWSRKGKWQMQRRFLRKRGAAGGETPSVKACGFATGSPLCRYATSLPGRGESVQGNGFRGDGKVPGIAQRRPLGGAGCERSEQTEGVLGLTSAAPHPTLRVTFPRRVKASVVARKFLVALDTLALRASACALSVTCGATSPKGRGKSTAANFLIMPNTLATSLRPWLPLWGSWHVSA